MKSPMRTRWIEGKRWGKPHPTLLLAIGLLAVCLFGCAKDDRTPLIVYSTHGIDMLEEFEKRFEAVEPGIDVQLLDMGSQDVLGRIRAEKQNPQADIWWGAPSVIFSRGAAEGLLEPYRPTWADHVAPQYHDPNDLWYGTFKTPEVIIFNSQVLTRETAPQDWDDLLDEKWRDKVIIRHPLASGTMRTIFGAMIWRDFRQSGSPEKGFQWLRGLDANTKDYAADPNVMIMKLSRQEGLVSLWNLTDALLQNRINGYPVDYIVPKSGTPVITDGIAIVKGAKRTEAEKFYEFVNSVESLTLQAEKFFRIPTRDDVTTLPDWLAGVEIPEMEIDWEEFGKQVPEWMRYWDENIKGQGARS